jgi:hypothetical protein
VAPPPRREPGDLALAGADVEHRCGAGEVRGGQREDLLLVLGVGALGEPVLPPAGVGLPQVCDPKPVQEHLPLLVGTGSPRMLRITARHADEWNTWGTPETVADRTEAFEQACEKVGRDPSHLWRSAQAMLFLTDDPDRVAKLRDHAPADRAIIGSVEQLIDTIGGYVELGVDELIIPDFTLGRDATERHATYRRIWDDIVPAFSSA